MPIHNTAAKKAARRFAAKHGVPYAQALRTVTSAHAGDTSRPGPNAARPALVWDGTTVDAQRIIDTAATYGVEVVWRSARDEHSEATLHVYENDGLRTIRAGGTALEARDAVTEQTLRTRAAFEPVAVDDRVRFAPQSGRACWTVRARNDRFIVATQQQPFQPKGTLWYTVVDLTGWNRRYNGVGPGVVRSSLDTLGGGWGIEPDGTGCEEILDGLIAGEWRISPRRVCAVEDIEIETAAH